MLSSKKNDRQREKAYKGSLIYSKLGIEMLIAVAVSAAVSLLLFFCTGFLEFKLIDKYRSNIDKETIEAVVQSEVKAFQSYVDKNGIKTDDFYGINHYSRKKPNLLLIIYDDNTVYFDSTSMFHDKNDRKKRDDANGNPNNIFVDTSYDVKFADKAAKIKIIYLFDYHMHDISVNCRQILSIMVFLILLLLFVARKTNYIKRVSNDIKILEGGNLEYPMEIKGSDEITELVQCVDDMRIAILLKQCKEKEIQAASRKFVTSMSHDLRTPLTVLIGMLDIIEEKKYQNNQQLESYIAKSREKAYQLKEMSDKLFEYFLAYNTGNDDLVLELYDVSVLNEMIDDWIFTVSEKGFNFDYRLFKGSFNLMLDIRYFRRILDNIFSNITKYADIDKPVVISAKVEQGMAVVHFSNTIKASLDQTESTNIGLDVCSRLTSCHKGEFGYDVKKNIFHCYIKLNIH